MDCANPHTKRNHTRSYRRKRITNLRNQKQNHTLNAKKNLCLWYILFVSNICFYVCTFFCCFRSCRKFWWKMRMMAACMDPSRKKTWLYEYIFRHQTFFTIQTILFLISLVLNVLLFCFKLFLLEIESAVWFLLWFLRWLLQTGVWSWGTIFSHEKVTSYKYTKIACNMLTPLFVLFMCENSLKSMVQALSWSTFRITRWTDYGERLSNGSPVRLLLFQKMSLVFKTNLIFEKH